MAIGTFGSFTQARLAIYAAQTGLSITGNNISNVNTEGYTRQRLDQGSLHIGGVDRYANPADVRTGQGVLCSGVSQLRDPYLDIRFRSANANLGANDVKLGGLEQIKSILDEVGKGEQAEGDDFGILGAQLVKFWSTIGDVTDQTGHAEYNLQVKTAAESLTRYLRDYSARLQEVYDDAVMAYEEDVAHVNGLLSSIREYNEEIRNCDIHGDKALELRDQRNVLLDELSQYLKINVIYGVEEIAPGLEVEKCTVKLDNANPDPKVLSDEAILIDGVYAGQLSIDQEPARRPLDPTDTTTWPYLDAEEKPVMDAADAAEAVIYNPNYDENDPDNPAASGRYIQDVTIGSDGSIVITSTNDRSHAMPALTPNPDADYTRPNAEGNEWYLNANGEPTTAAADSAHTLEANPDYRPYLNGKDEPVADVKDAKLVNNPNFSLTLSELRNREGYLHYIMEKQLPQTIQKNNDPNAGEDANLEYERAVYFALQPQPITSRDANGNTVLSNYYQSGQDDNGDPIYTRQDFVQILSTPVSFDDNDLHGALQADRELLTEKGEFTDTSIIDGTNENRLYCDEKAATKRGIPYYQRSLDLLANQLAKVMNEANRGYYVDDKGNYVGAVYNDDGTRKVTEQSGKFVGAPVTVQYQTTDADGNPVTATYSLKKGDTKASLDRVDPNIWNTMQEHFNAAKEQDLIPDNETFDTVEDFLSLPRMLKFEAVDPNDGSTVTSWDVIRDADGNPIPNGIFDGGNLFSNHGASDDDTNITASNISVSFSWSSDAIDMVRSFECPPGESEPVSGANGGFLHFQLLANKKFDFVPSDLFSTRDGSSNVMFRGSFAEMYQNIQAVLGNDQKVTKDALNASYQTAMEIDTNRDSVSAVDFNDEAMNLMMYSKSYNAACRLMTTIDSVLDKLINGTGMTT